LAERSSKTDLYPTGTDIKLEIKSDTMPKEDTGEELSSALTSLDIVASLIVNFECQSPLREC